MKKNKGGIIVVGVGKGPRWGVRLGNGRYDTELLVCVKRVTRGCVTDIVRVTVCYGRVRPLRDHDAARGNV